MAQVDSEDTTSASAAHCEPVGARVSKPRIVRCRLKKRTARRRKQAVPPMLPPPTGEKDRLFGPSMQDVIAMAVNDGSPLAAIMRQREEVATEVERLLAFLDETDGDSDAEGYLHSGNRFYEADLEGDEVDDEPSLGSLDTLKNQDAAWGAGRTHIFNIDAEAEDEHDEPVLGSIEDHPGIFGGKRHRHIEPAATRTTGRAIRAATTARKRTKPAVTSMTSRTTRTSTQSRLLDGQRTGSTASKVST